MRAARIAEREIKELERGIYHGRLEGMKPERRTILLITADTDDPGNFQPLGAASTGVSRLANFGLSGQTFCEPRLLQRGRLRLLNENSLEIHW
jgi:hypothetical protein